MTLNASNIEQNLKNFKSPTLPYKGLKFIILSRLSLTLPTVPSLVFSKLDSAADQVVLALSTNFWQVLFTVIYYIY